MRVNFEKLYAVIDAISREVTGYDSKDRKNHTLDITLAEADIAANILVSILTMSCEFEKDGKKYFCSVEVYDDMDNMGPVITIRKPVIPR